MQQPAHADLENSWFQEIDSKNYDFSLAKSLPWPISGACVSAHPILVLLGPCANLLQLVVQLAAVPFSPKGAIYTGLGSAAGGRHWKIKASSFFSFFTLMKQVIWPTTCSCSARPCMWCEFRPPEELDEQHNRLLLDSGEFLQYQWRTAHFCDGVTKKYKLSVFIQVISKCY